MTANDVIAALAAVAEPEYAAGAAGYFRTGPGEYGEGDVFIGVRVPKIRTVVKQFEALPQPDVEALLASEIHEHRLAALFILSRQFEVARRRRDTATQERIVAAYLNAVERNQINNWDLVDSSATGILGTWLLDGSPELLFELADRPGLWDRRVAVLASFAFLDAGDASVTLALAEKLLPDRRDLIQKAVGWSLRHMGKRIGSETLLAFLETHASAMGRTALSYATEHVDSATRARLRAL